MQLTLCKQALLPLYFPYTLVINHVAKEPQCSLRPDVRILESYESAGVNQPPAFSQ